MKSLLLLLTLVALAAPAAAGDISIDYAPEIKLGCSFPVDPLAGVEPGQVGDSSAVKLANYLARQTFNDEAGRMLSQMYGSVSSNAATMFAGFSSSWSSISDAWYYDLMPSLSQEDSNILLYLMAGFHGGSKGWTMAKGLYVAEKGLVIGVPMVFLIDAYKPGVVAMKPETKQFYAAFFAADASRIRQLIDQHRDTWRRIVPIIEDVCSGRIK